MTKGNYTLRDWGYFKLLQLIAEVFDFQEIDYALVGGAAIQARTADAFYKYEGLTAPDVPDLLLRKTKDFDISTHSSEEDLVSLLNFLQLENEPLTVRPKQPRRVNLTYAGRNFEPVALTLNYQLGPQDFSGLGDEFYDECLRTAEELSLHYNNEEARVRVATPECIIASKLTRGSPKDIVDISGLLRILTHYKVTKPFNYGLVKKYLKDAGKEHCFQNLDTITMEILRD